MVYVSVFVLALYLLYVRPRRKMAVAAATGHYVSGLATVDLRKLSLQPAYVRLAVPDLTQLRRPTGFFVHGDCPGKITFSPDGWHFTPRPAAWSLGASKIEGRWADVIAGEAFFGTAIQVPQLVLYLVDGSRFTAQTEDIDNLQTMLTALGIPAPQTSARSSVTSIIREEIKRLID